MPNYILKCSLIPATCHFLKQSLCTLTYLSNLRTGSQIPPPAFAPNHEPFRQKTSKRCQIVSRWFFLKPVPLCCFRSRLWCHVTTSPIIIMGVRPTTFKLSATFFDKLHSRYVNTIQLHPFKLNFNGGECFAHKKGVATPNFYFTMSLSLRIKLLPQWLNLATPVWCYLNLLATDFFF